MPPTTGFSFGDILLVPFPFTDQSATKRRPAVVVSTERYNHERADLIIMAITSQARSAGLHGEMQVTDWKDAGLLKPSTVKPVIATIQQSLVIRRLGRLKEADQAALKRALAAIVG
jgi:mRNA interferase MazF